MTQEQIRAQLKSLMAATVRNERNWHYAMVRPLPIPSREAALHGSVRADCSFGCKILAKLAGALDPTGGNFNGLGNSVSMYEHLPHVSIASLKVGDCIVYGYGGADHAVMVYEPGRDPLVWSHGQEAGPQLVRHSVEDRFHRGPSTGLRLQFPAAPKPKPKPKPKPRPKLPASLKPWAAVFKNWNPFKA